MGVVHTHPGSLRHPSDGDYQGDSEWVACLRGGEGVFGIGTADGPDAAVALFAQQPRPNVQCLGELRFSWYALGQGDSDYRPMPLELTIGPDLARLCTRCGRRWRPTRIASTACIDQLAGVRFEAMSDERGPGLMLTLPLAAGGEAVCVLVRQKEVRYCVLRGGEPLAVDVNDDCVDRGVYLLLAELAGRCVRVSGFRPPGRSRPVFLVSRRGVLTMDFRPLNDLERRQLINALRGNAESDRAILMNRRDTSFAGAAEEVPDEEVINAIKSVPCHY